MPERPFPPRRKKVNKKLPFHEQKPEAVDVTPPIVSIANVQDGEAPHEEDPATASPFRYIVTDDATAESVAASAAAIALSALNHDSLQTNLDDTTGSTSSITKGLAVESHLQDQLQAYMDQTVSTVVLDATSNTAEDDSNVNATIPLVYSVDHQETASSSQLHLLSTALLPKAKFKTSNLKKRKSETTAAAKNYIEGNPTDDDVLMGRGGRSNHHPGNARYLQEKLKIQERYRKAIKEEKTGISQELVNAVKSWGGRFLKIDSEQRWYEVDNATARKKASQTLREDNTPERRAEKRAKYCTDTNKPAKSKASSKKSSSSSSTMSTKKPLTVAIEEVMAPQSPDRSPHIVVIQETSV